MSGCQHDAELEAYNQRFSTQPKSIPQQVGSSLLDCDHQPVVCRLLMTRPGCSMSLEQTRSIAGSSTSPLLLLYSTSSFRMICCRKRHLDSSAILMISWSLLSYSGFCTGSPIEHGHKRFQS